ncbi:hypothetical protein HYU50_00855 [Candidatus Woesearchaeota archaeon]|nr:hypothetical protein [Candidatus Woesearchaeota archaeon]
MPSIFKKEVEMKANSKLQKKTQITIFLIIGIVMVMVAVSLILVARYASKKVSKQETVDVKEASFDVQPVKNFVTECLSVTSKNGLKLLGQQGGYLFRSQGGLLVDYPGTDEGIFFIKNDNSKVIYDILKPRFPVREYMPSIPSYPWKTFPYTDESKAAETFQGKSAFGFNNFPPINSSFGQNSMQQQLISYTENNIDKCLDFSIFENQGISVIKGKKEVNVGINENDVVFRMRYDMVIENLVSGEKTSLNDFLVRHKVRLGKLHNFISNLIESDIGDIKFNILNNTISSFDVELKKDAHNNDDLIIITDKDSSLDNQPYKYYFARKNRNPALFYLAPEEISLPALDEEGEFTIVTKETLLGPQELIALDSDEDLITSESFSITPEPPVTLLFPSINFKVSVTDNEVEDYQIIKVLRESS